MEFFDEAVRCLREQIIARITWEPALKYHLASLFWQDAAGCFPKSSFPWDSALFRLDLVNRKLSVEGSTYPNQFGASRQEIFSLSAAEFHRIAQQCKMDQMMQVFVSDEDWAKLFDDDLNAAVAAAWAALEKKEEDRRKETIRKHAVKLPADCATLQPRMDLSGITITLRQPYAVSGVTITRESGWYHLVSTNTSRLSDSTRQYARVLSAAEAVWLEKQVETVISDPDDSTWHSLPGGDLMSLSIKGSNGQDVSIQWDEPLNKYVALKRLLEDLAVYGSQA